MSSVFLPPDDTRLVTIIAHVDHGKTTLADNLIEYNGIISERLAGTLRYLDSDPEEQRRGITMRSSAIGLQHKFVDKPNKPAQSRIIHLLDSPGHTDFSMEVSSALVACDSCLLVLDAVEGMAPRTHQVLREAYVHRLVPILVINKIDRLYSDLGLDPTESYLRMRTLLETVNAAAAAMLTSASQQQEEETPEEDEFSKLWTFDPAVGNVIFASALFGWGFTCQSLARSLFRQKVLPFKPPFIKAMLFSDGKFNGEKVLKWSPDHDTQPLFAEYALQPLWTIYEAVASAAAVEQKIKATTPGMERALEALQEGSTGADCPITTEALQRVLTQIGTNSEESVLRAVLRRYRPLAGTVLDTICEYSPSPAKAVKSVRSNILALQALQGERLPEEIASWKILQDAVQSCNASTEVPTVAHVCKFMATDRLHIRDPDLPGENSENLILGLARVLSGSLKTGETYNLYGPKHKQNVSPPQRCVRLYLLMGSSFVKVDQVPAGHLCAVYNLEGIAFKTVTLSDSLHGMPLCGFAGANHLRPLVKVHVEPENAADTDALERGLVKLSLADAAVEVTATARGETILACLGELHLEQSILDLERVYCGKEMKVRISDPIVDFGETTTWFENETNDFVSFYNDKGTGPLRQMKIPPYNEEEGISYAHRGRSRAMLSGRGAAIRLRAVPLAPSVYQALKDGKVPNDTDELVRLGRGLCMYTNNEDESNGAKESMLKKIQNLVCSLDSNGNALMESPGLRKGICIQRVNSSNGEVYAPSTVSGNKDEEEEGTDAGVRDTEGFDAYESLSSTISQSSNFSSDEGIPAVDETAVRIWTQEMKGSAVAGFRMALRSGWICEEPVRNVLIILEGVEIASTAVSGGLVVSALRSGIRSALLSRPARLMERYLRLTLHASLAGVGSLYQVLNKRRGKVLDDSMVDGTDLLLITALIPQAESFGLAPELLRKTSGEVTAPELIFSHWELLDVDPFWIPTSEEEREDFGEVQQSGDSSTGVDNTALKYIRKVRERKGLMVDSSRTVVAAEKQRTLKR